MIWSILFACQETEKNTPSCSSNAGITISSQQITLEANACSSLSLSPRILGQGALSVRWEQNGNTITPILTAQETATFSGLILEGNYDVAGEKPIRLWKQGYQSWWWSGVTDLVNPEYDEEGIPLVGGDDHGTSATEEKPYSSWWLGLVGRDQGESILIGALASTKTRVWTAFSEEKAWLVWGHRGDRIHLEAGEDLILDPVWFKSGDDAFDLHVEYAHAAAQYHEIAPRTDKPPVGWATWYTFYAEIDEEIVRGNLDVAVELANDPALTPMTVFQIDDGWQEHWGDWKADEHFPSGMATLAQEIQSAGFTR